MNPKIEDNIEIEINLGTKMELDRILVEGQTYDQLIQEMLIVLHTLEWRRFPEFDIKVDSNE